ncbi:hypothetical protein AYX14_06430, partial [Cryptococcus neoformans]
VTPLSATSSSSVCNLISKPRRAIPNKQCHRGSIYRTKNDL